MYMPACSSEQMKRMLGRRFCPVPSRWLAAAPAAIMTPPNWRRLKLLMFIVFENSRSLGIRSAISLILSGRFTRVAAGTSEALRAIGRLAAQRRAAASLPKRSCRPPSLCGYYLRNEYCLCAELQGPVQQRNCDLVEESHQYENLVDRDSRICINLPHVWPDHR